MMLTMLFISLALTAQTKYYKTTLLAIDKFDGYGMSKWQYCEIDIEINFSTNRIIIYSDETQIIDLKESIITQYDGYNVLTANADDTRYNNMIIYIYMYYNKDAYIKIEYPGKLIYKYKLK